MKLASQFLLYQLRALCVEQRAFAIGPSIFGCQVPQQEVIRISYFYGNRPADFCCKKGHRGKGPLKKTLKNALTI
jgi:hypothetical protein